MKLNFIKVRPVILLLSLVAGSSCSADKDSETTITVEGQIELVDEFANELESHAGVTVTFELENEELVTHSDASGNYTIAIPSWEEVLGVTFSKEGFATQEITTNPQDAEKYIIEISAISSLEVYNLEVVPQDPSGPFFQLSFEAENYYTDQSQKRYFDLQVYHLNGDLINTLRFFGFQDEADIGTYEEVVPLSDSRAKITYNLFRVWFLNGYATDQQFEFRLYGATNNTSHQFYEEDLLDNSVNSTYASAVAALQ